MEFSKSPSKLKRVFGAAACCMASVALVSSLALTGCGGSGNTSGGSAGGKVTVQGSDTLVNMSQAWAEAYQGTNSNVTVSVTGGGSGTGIAALINGTTDFANASREMKDEEKAELPNAVETTVAYDGISVIVNKANKVTKLTSEQLGKIYRGEITNWKEVGGADKKITMCSRDTASGTYEFFKESVVDTDAGEKEIASSALYLTSNQTILDEVAKNDGAIGYIGLGYVNDTVQTITLDGVAPSVDTVKDKSYELSRGLYMYSNGEPNETMKGFLDYVLSAEGQKIVEEQGFVSL